MRKLLIELLSEAVISGMLTIFCTVVYGLTYFFDNSYWIDHKHELVYWYILILSILLLGGIFSVINYLVDSHIKNNLGTKYFRCSKCGHHFPLMFKYRYGSNLNDECGACNSQNFFTRGY